MKGLMIALGKGKAEDSEPDMGSEDSGGSASAYAKEAFSALKDDDEAGFVAAFLGAVKACKAEPYSDDEEEDEEV